MIKWRWWGLGGREELTMGAEGRSSDQELLERAALRIYPFLINRASDILGHKGMDHVHAAAAGSAWKAAEALVKARPGRTT